LLYELSRVELFHNTHASFDNRRAIKLHLNLSKKVNELFIQRVLLYILGDNGVKRVPKLVRHAGINELRELLFSFDVSVHNIVRHINSLKHPFDLIILFIFLELYLYVSIVLLLF
jgi:hypothetical protein